MNYTNSSDNELLKIFNDNGDVVKPELRVLVHNKPYVFWHGVCNIWLVNKQGDILCSKRSSLVAGNPDKWQTYFGGHVKAGNTFIQTALLELEEEIGLKLKSTVLQIFEEDKSREYMHIFTNFVHLFSEDMKLLKFSDGEVSSVKWFSFKQYQSEIKQNPDSWCNKVKLEQYQKIIEMLEIDILI